MTSVTAVCWPALRAAEGLELLARAAGLPTRVRPAPRASEDARVEHHVATAAATLELDVEPVDTSFGEADAFLRRAGPAIVRIGPDALIMLEGRRGRRARIVTPDHRIETVSIEVLRRALVDQAAAPLVAESERLVAETDIRSSRRSRVVRALVAAVIK